MLLQNAHKPIVLSTETGEPTRDQVILRHSRDQSEHDGEHSEGVPADSPESRPAHPELNSKSLLLLIFSVFVVVALASIVVFLFWGMAAAVLVFVFGTGILCIGNPELWATSMRAKERRGQRSQGDGEENR